VLARIVVEIRAADIAVELEPYYTVMSVFSSFPRCICVLVFQVVFEIMLYVHVYVPWYHGTSCIVAILWPYQVHVYYVRTRPW
jgi:hypothetical protein